MLNACSIIFGWIYSTTTCHIWPLHNLQASESLVKFLSATLNFLGVAHCSNMSAGVP